MITEDYISFETAKLLKEKGFDWDCKSKRFYPEPDYDQESPNGVYAPTLQTAMKWLREVHNLFIEPIAGGENDGKFWYVFDVIPVNGRNIKWNYYENMPTEEYSSPEEACEAAIKYCLENLV